MSYLDYAYPKKEMFNDQVSGLDEEGNGNFFKKPFSKLNIRGQKGAIIKEVIEGGKKYCCITSKIYLMTDATTITPGILNYSDNFYDNLMKIWDNKTFQNENSEEVTIKLDVEVFLMPTYSIAPLSFPNVIGFKENFSNGEVILYLNSVIPRSFINADRRTGFMNLNDQGNTASHEFGHILGLADRYCYFHFYIKSRTDLKERNRYNDDSGASNQIQKLIITNPINKGITREGKRDEVLHGFNVIGEGSSVPMIEPFFAGDLEYGNDCNWKKNLMALGGSELTAFQLRIVCNNSDVEPDYIQYSFFAPSTNNKKPGGIVPSIIGLNNGNIIVDIRHQAICSIEQLISLTIFSFDYHYFNPTIGINAIDINDYYLEDGELNKEKFEKLDYGGYLRSEIIDMALGGRELNEINSKIKTAEVTGNFPGSKKYLNSRTKDIFKNIGKGDNHGKEIWSSSWDRTYKHIVVFGPTTTPKIERDL